MFVEYVRRVPYSAVNPKSPWPANVKFANLSMQLINSHMGTVPTKDRVADGSR